MIKVIAVEILTECLTVNCSNKIVLILHVVFIMSVSVLVKCIKLVPFNSVLLTIYRKDNS